MMRVCQLDTCPVGVATQNPELRARFTGKAEYVVNFFEFVAQEVRELLASLGFRSVEEAVGHVEVLDTRRAVAHWKASGAGPRAGPARPEGPGGLDAAPLDDAGPRAGEGPGPRPHRARGRRPRQRHPGAHRAARPQRQPHVGTLLGHELTKKWGEEGLPDGTVDVTLTGSAGSRSARSCPAASRCGCSATPTTTSARACPAAPSSCGPTPRRVRATGTSWRATSSPTARRAGSCSCAVRWGERFCVRNSGATAVVEGVGDHALEYMTGGEVVVLGRVGRNVAAGMSAVSPTCSTSRSRA